MAVRHLEVASIVGDRVDLRDKDGRGVALQLLPGEGAKWKTGAKLRLGPPPSKPKSKAKK